MAVVRVGMVGIGSMALPMALRLQNQGYAVTVFDTDPTRAALATRNRLRVAPTAAEAALFSRCTIISLADEAEVHEALFGDHGVMTVAKAGDCVMLCTTLPPDTVERYAQALVSRNVQCIDAPLSGSPESAKHGMHTMIVAADPAAFERHRPMIEVMSSRVIRVGSQAGLASHAKMVNNVAAAINLAGMAEAMALADKVGLDLRQMLEIIESSSGQSWIGSDRLARAHRGDTQVHASVQQASHDIHHALKAAQGLGLRLPLTLAAAHQYEHAAHDGLAHADDSSLYPYVRDGGALIQDVQAAVAQSITDESDPDRANQTMVG
jgi:L-threonate 2-dehydrogenase